MRRALPICVFVCLVLFSGVLFFTCRTPAPPPTSQFSDDWVGLFVAVTKGFSGQTYYLGSDEQWSYFDSGSIYRKVQTSRMHLPLTFPFLQGKRYPIQLTNFVGYEKKEGT
jgi:hypothetical protein